MGLSVSKLTGVDKSMVKAVDEVQQLLGYSFRDPKLLQEALTHSSYPDRPSYKRLEHLGDAALRLAFTKYFFTYYPKMVPGRLSDLRDANISNEKLARIAAQHGLYRFIRRHNTHELDLRVVDFGNTVRKETSEEDGVFWFGGSTMKAPDVLAYIVKSIAGAVYVDCNFNLEVLWKVIREFLKPIVKLSTLVKHPVTALKEFCEKHKKTLDHDFSNPGNSYITNIFVDEELLGVGSAEQKEISKLNASKEALLKLFGSEPEEMSKESSFDEVEHIICDCQNLLYKLWRAVAVGIKLVVFVLLAAIVFCFSLIFFFVVVERVSVN